MNIDPAIFYIFVVPDGSPYEATPMQGFSYSLCNNSQLLRVIATLPTSVYDLTTEGRDTFISRRMAGVSPVRWHGISPKALRAHAFPEIAPFSLIFLPNEESPTDYSTWMASNQVKPALVAKSGGDLTYADLSISRLQQHFLSVCEHLGIADVSQVSDLRDALTRWSPLTSRRLDYQVGGHNTVTPNLCALSAAGFDDLVFGRFTEINRGLEPYVQQIVRTTDSIFKEREVAGRRDMQRIFRRPPDLNLFAPAIYPWFFNLPVPAGLGRAEAKRFIAARQVLQRQSGYGFEITSEWQQSSVFGASSADLKEGAKPSPHGLLWLRARELFLATDVMSVLAASEFSAVVRWPNEINRTLGAVRSFAQHYRSHAAPSSRKRLLAFRQVQTRLMEATPVEFFELIRAAKDGVRIVADAHLEWLDLDGLPLMIRKDCSRIPVTPGNLFIDVLAAKSPLHLTPQAFDSVLVIRALERDDPISNIFETVFDQFDPDWRSSTTLRVVNVSSEDELISAINSYHGPMIVFDGHGAHEVNGAGKLYLGSNVIDIWSLRDKIVEMAPIVILSACDTHAADRNHATTANGFLSLGARSVLSSVFPLNAAHAAIFVARLILRVRLFLKEAPLVFDEAITWLEVMSGMLRMQLMTDFLMQLHFKDLINQEQYESIHLAGNTAINGRSPDPFSNILAGLERLGLSGALLRAELEIAIANSSVISYLHIGRPETILIDVVDRISRQFDRLSATAIGDFSRA